MARRSRLALAFIRLRAADLLTIPEISRQAGVEAKTWRSWERGTHIPKIETLRRVEQQLGLERGSLVFIRDEQLRQRSYDNGRRRAPKGEMIG